MAFRQTGFGGGAPHAYPDGDGDLQRLVDALFLGRADVDRLDAVVLAETRDLGADAMEIVQLLPPGRYDRGRLCDQLNSAVAAHGWAQTVGTVE